MRDEQPVRRAAARTPRAPACRTGTPRRSRRTGSGRPASAGSSGTGSRGRRAPAGRATRSPRAAPRSAAPSSSRSRRPAPCTGGTAGPARGRRSSRAPPRRHGPARAAVRTVTGPARPRRARSRGSPRRSPPRASRPPGPARRPASRGARARCRCPRGRRGRSGCPPRHGPRLGQEPRRRPPPPLGAIDLVRLDGDPQLPGPLEVHVHAVVARRSLDPVEVLLTEPVEDVLLVRPPGRPFSSPWVSDAAQKPPLRPDAAQPSRSRLEQHDRAAGVPLLRAYRGPQPGVAAADHARSASIGR